MNLFIVTFVSIFACFEASSIWDNVTIVVVEYQPIQISNLNETETVNQNTKRYVNLMKSINESNLDIVIFPESTLRVGHQTAIEYVAPTPCESDGYPEYMQRLSCAARNQRTYLVVNLVEKIKCDQIKSRSDNCNNDGFHYYNTDFVLDRNGTIVNRYHKYNLFGEETMDKPDVAEEIVTKTDFGLNLGIFTCFDILFKAPALKLLDDGIDGVIYPAMWFSGLPFLTAMQVQQMYAYGHNISLFAAGANNPNAGSGGSGVYRGTEGAVVGGINAEGGTNIFIYKGGDKKALPEDDVDEQAKKMDGFYLKVDSGLKDYHFEALNTSLKHSTVSLSYVDTKGNSLFCKFDVEISTEEPKSHLNHYTYLFVAYAGVRSFSGVYNGGIELCGIIACLNSSVSSCGQRFPRYQEVEWPVTFDKIVIKGIFEDTENKTQLPNSLLSSLRPIDTSETEWSSKKVEDSGKGAIEWTFSTKKPQDRLMTFAIYGRNYDNDSPVGGRE